jgi:hypothetical protein
MSPKLPCELLPGDHLIYTGRAFVDRLIQLKTFSMASHIEIYAGSDQSAASRPGKRKGVRLYPLRKEDLAYVLRPTMPFDFQAAMVWFYGHAIGAPYAYTELVNFFLPGAVFNAQGMVCSTFARMFDEHGSFYPFKPEWTELKVAPANFLMVNCFDWVWTKEKM